MFTFSCCFLAPFVANVFTNGTEEIKGCATGAVLPLVAFTPFSELSRCPDISITVYIIRSKGKCTVLNRFHLAI